MLLKFHFHSSTNLISRLVSWRTSSHISHVSVELNGEYYQSYLGATFYRTRVVPLDIVETVPLFITSDMATEIQTYLKSHLGTPYDRRSIIGFILNIRRQTQSRLNCSEMAHAVLGMIITKNVKYTKLVTPDSIRTAVNYFKLGLEHTR